MNRLFFRPEQAGMTKTDAAAQTLAGINPDVALESFTSNITTLQARPSLPDDCAGAIFGLLSRALRSSACSRHTSDRWDSDAVANTHCPCHCSFNSGLMDSNMVCTKAGHAQGFDAFKASLCNSAGRLRTDLVLSCVDNYEARMTINQARALDCLAADKA